jgi:hypothetical protein
MTDEVITEHVGQQYGTEAIEGDDKFQVAES